jgi:hypothetical protein
MSLYLEGDLPVDNLPDHRKGMMMTSYRSRDGEFDFFDFDPLHDLGAFD